MRNPNMIIRDRRTVAEAKALEAKLGTPIEKIVMEQCRVFLKKGVATPNRRKAR